MQEIIGKSVNRIDAAAKVTGAAQYPGDINLPHQAHMKMIFSSRAHAVIRSIDISQAQKLPGVLAVLTARDVPCNEYGIISQDQPVLCGPGSAKPFTDRVRFAGDKIALVVAESDAIAEAACRLIRIDSEDLPALDDPLTAMQPDTPLLHPQNASNIFFEEHIRKGDVEDAFSQADVIVSAEYRTPAQEHAFLQTEAGLSYVDDAGRVHVITSGQWAHNDQNQIAHALQIPLEDVQVSYAAIGGAFGGKEDISVQIALALAAWKLYQAGIPHPVKIVWSREESFSAHPKRHPFIIRAKWGAAKTGKITAAEIEIIADGGAYASSSEAVVGSAATLAAGPYFIPNIKIDACAVYTNHIPSGAFRGFGSPQVTFAAEMQINKLAEKLGLDPVEMRMRNVIREGKLSAVDSPLPQGISIEKVIRACALKAGWQETENGWQRPKRDADRHVGLGFSAGFKCFGIPPDACWATVEIHGAETIDKAVVRFAGADMGQGAQTVYAQFAASALNIPLEKVAVINADTDQTGDAGSASASRLTFMSGNAILAAANLALAAWDKEERPAIGRVQYHSPEIPNHTGHGESTHPNFGYGYTAEVVRAEIDETTGRIELLQVVCADDVGKAINPLQVKGQIEGATLQGAGYALLEDLKYDQCRLRTRNLTTYLIPTIMDIPGKMDTLILEEADPNGPCGARGVGEMPLVTFAPALADAVHDACGLWIDSLPITPERFLQEKKIQLKKEA